MWKPAECRTVDLSPQLLAKSVICSMVESTSGETHVNTAHASHRQRGSRGVERGAHPLDWVSQS